MKKHSIRFIFLTLLLLFAFFLSSCKIRQKENAAVTVTIEPLKYFVDRLTSGKIDVNVMVPMGVNPVTYSPTTSQLISLSSSNLYVQVGHLGFEESWMGRLKELNPEMQVINLSENIELIKGKDHIHGDHVHSGGIDPHIWMSPKLVLKFIPILKEQLIKIFPERKSLVEKNYPVLLAEVKELDKSFSELISKLGQKKFMIFHPALTYLARDYGLEQISIEYEGKEPSPQMLRDLIDLANTENIRVIFIQAEFDQRNAEMVRKATNAKLITINPLAYDWKNSIKKILNLLSTYLK